MRIMSADPNSRALTLSELETRERELVAADAALAAAGHMQYAARRQSVADRLYAVRAGIKAELRNMAAESPLADQVAEIVEGF